MAKFPAKENEVIAQGDKVIAGLQDYPDIFPDPTLPLEELIKLRDEYLAARKVEISAQAALEQAVDAKRATLHAYAEGVKTELRFAENAVNFDDAKLKLLGWGGRKSKTPTQAPGQARDLDIIRQGAGTITLRWRAPSDGGAGSAYRVQRLDRFAVDAPWLDAGMSVETEIALAHQERGKEFEFRVLGVNKVGDGVPSNTVAATL